MRAKLTATVRANGTVTLPGPVRRILGLRSRSARVGFVFEPQARAVWLAPVGDKNGFTAADYRTLLALRRAPGRKTFVSVQALLRDLRGN